DLPPLPPPRADLQPDVRLQRELRAAVVARRGRARQGLALFQDGRLRPLAETGQPPRALCLHVGASRQEAVVHGRRAGPAGGVEPRAVAGLAPARATGARRHAVAGARSEPPVPRRAGPLRAGLRPDGLLVAGAQRRRQQRPRVRSPVARGGAGGGVRRQPVAGPARELPPRAAPVGPLARGAEHRFVLLRRHRRRQPGWRATRADPLAQPTVLGGGHLASTGRALAGPRGVTRTTSGSAAARRTARSTI